MPQQGTLSKERAWANGLPIGLVMVSGTSKLPELALTGYSGIGLQVHEAPYLRGGNNVRLSIGNTFSNEPGIYILGEVRYPSVACIIKPSLTFEKIGIRLEDCFVIDEDGNSRFLTAGVGGTARSPWDP